MRKSDPWLAMVLLTRLPLPHLPPEAFADGARAVWAYPLVGVIVGALGAGVAALAAGLSDGIAAGLALAAMMLVTGAMHEDGLADLCDGFWGGDSPARRLEIMRDSQIGSFGVLALIVVTGLRWSAIAALIPIGPGGIVAAAALSRAMMPTLMVALPHARGDGLSRSVGRPDTAMAGLGLLTGTLIALLCVGAGALPLLALAAATTACVGWIARRKIGGQTGDVLGACQQLAELAVLMGCVALIGP